MRERVKTVSRARRLELTVASDEDGNDETVNRDNTRHDDGKDRLHDEFGSHYAHRRYSRSALCRSVGGAETWNA